MEGLFKDSFSEWHPFHWLERTEGDHSPQSNLLSSRENEANYIPLEKPRVKLQSKEENTASQTASDGTDSGMGAECTALLRLPPFPLS